MTFPDGPPNYGSAPEAELEVPRSPAYLVFTPQEHGTSVLAGYSPDQLWLARRAADLIGGLVVRVPVIADYRPERTS